MPVESTSACASALRARSFRSEISLRSTCLLAFTFRHSHDRPSQYVDTVAVAASRKVGTFSLAGATLAMALACSRIGWKLQQHVSCRSCRSFSPLTSRYRLLCLCAAGPCVFRQMLPSSSNVDASIAPFPCTFKRDRRPEALCPSFQHLQHIPPSLSMFLRSLRTVSACAPSSFLISPHAENVG